MKKSTVIKISVTAVVIVGLAIWINSRWRAWFVSLPEEPYVTYVTPDRVTLLPGEDFDTERIITWRCDTILKASYLEFVSGTDTVIQKAKGNVVSKTMGEDEFIR